MAKIGEIGVNTPSGVVYLPVFSVGDSGSNILEALRVNTPPESSAVIDDFEDSSPIGEYSGDTGNWTVVSSPVYEGSNAIRSDADFNKIYDTDHQNSPSQGDEFEYQIRSTVGDSGTGNIHGGWMLFGLQNSGDYYEIRFRFANSSIELYRRDGGTDTYLGGTSLSSTVNADEWYKVNVKWDDGSTFGGSAGDITVEVFNSNGTSIGSTTINDTTYTSGGIGFDGDIDTANNHNFYIDYVQLLGTSDGVGFIPLADPSKAAYPYLRVYTAQGTMAVHDSATAGKIIDNFENYPDTTSDAWQYGEAYYTDVTSPVKKGSYALEGKAIGDSFRHFSAPFDGAPDLNYYPQQGDTIEWWTRVGTSSGHSVFAFGKETNHSTGEQNEIFLNVGRSGQSTPSAFAISVDTGGGYSEKDGAPVNISKDTWYRIKLDWGTDGSMVATLFDASGNQMAQISHTDDTYQGRGIQLRFEDHAYWDHIRKI